MENKMKDYLPKIELDKMQALLEIEELFETGRATLEEARRMMAERVGSIRPYHIAFIEQNLMEADDEECRRVDMHRTMELLEGFMDHSRPELSAGHPIGHYYAENDEMRRLLLAVEDLVQYPMIKNQWLELYEKIGQYPLHYKRKQNQLYPVLEQKGFSRPTTTMWTFDDLIRDEIRQSQQLLEDGEEEAFIKLQETLIAHARDLMEKEELILYPTSMALISEPEFEDMKSGDQEIGFAFFNVEHTPRPQASPTAAPGDFAADMQDLLAKYGYSAGGNNKLDVTTGKLTLEQINLIYKHLPVDISFVDENELVCFYSDTDHRIFPRSKNVIGREVMNCHPRKSAHIVREVIDKLRSGEQDKAEFWINKPGLFIYIIYVAVRDKDGRFRGVIEMMQDCTHIRAMQGSQTLLTWSRQETPTEESQPATEQEEDAGEPVNEITGQTRLKDLLNRYPDLKKRLPEISSAFKMLSSPLGKLMVGKADVKMMSERSGVPLDRLVEGIKRLIAQ